MFLYFYICNAFLGLIKTHIMLQYLEIYSKVKEDTYLGQF